MVASSHLLASEITCQALLWEHVVRFDRYILYTKIVRLTVVFILYTLMAYMYIQTGIILNIKGDCWYVHVFELDIGHSSI